MHRIRPIVADRRHGETAGDHRDDGGHGDQRHHDDHRARDPAAVHDVAVHVYGAALHRGTGTIFAGTIPAANCAAGNCTTDTADHAAR